MTIAHSFFIPDIEYLVDIKGLIKYLGEKISIGNVCLYCNGRGRELRSLEAVRAHMVSAFVTFPQFAVFICSNHGEQIDKGHCKIAYEADEDALELVDYYDFSSSYAQLEEEGIDVDDEDLSSLTQRIRLADDNMSLILPNGNVVGHRSLKRYYDQSFKPEEVRKHYLAGWPTNRTKSMLPSLLVDPWIRPYQQAYRTILWNGTVPVDAFQSFWQPYAYHRRPRKQTYQINRSFQRRTNPPGLPNSCWSPVEQIAKIFPRPDHLKTVLLLLSFAFLLPIHAVSTLHMYNYSNQVWLQTMLGCIYMLLFLKRFLAVRGRNILLTERSWASGQQERVPASKDILILHLFPSFNFGICQGML